MLKDKNAEMCPMLSLFSRIMGIDLVDNLLHTGDRGVPFDAVDVDKLYIVDSVVIADIDSRLSDLVAQTVVDKHNKLNSGVIFLHRGEHVGHSRAEFVEIVFCPVVIFEFSDGYTCPGIVGAPEDIDDVGVAEIFHAGNKRPVGIVVALIAGVADRRAGERVVAAHAVAAFGDELVPPGLIGATYICGTGRFLPVPYIICIGVYTILERRIGIAEDRNTLAALSGD